MRPVDADWLGERYDGREFQRRLDSAPTLDVAEVTHSRWENTDRADCLVQEMSCEACGFTIRTDKPHRWRFCSGCGARMDKKLASDKPDYAWFKTRFEEST